MAEEESRKMDIETLDPVTHLVSEGETNPKRGREEDAEFEDQNGHVSKKQKAEEERFREVQSVEGTGVEEGKTGSVSLGPKNFGSSVEMFDYFFKLLHNWSPNVNINKYEHMVLQELLKKGQQEPEKKIDEGYHAFQVRNHPIWKARCFFVIRDDESVVDFSFRKCVDCILPLPKDMKTKPDIDKVLGGPGGNGRKGGKNVGGGRGGGQGRGGNLRN